MARSFYHEHPDTLVVETEIADAQPGRVLLAQSPFYPGGGGQVADRDVVPDRAAEHGRALGNPRHLLPPFPEIDRGEVRAANGDRAAVR